MPDISYAIHLGIRYSWQISVFLWSQWQGLHYVVKPVAPSCALPQLSFGLLCSIARFLGAEKKK